MRGSTFKRCSCPATPASAGRRTTCAKSHGSWSYRVDVPGAVPGQRRQVTKGGFPTRRAAEAALADRLNKLGMGEVVIEDRRLMADYLGEWLTGMRLTLATTAWTNYRSILNLYVLPRIGQLRLTSLTGPRLTAVYADLLDHGGVKGRCLSPTTVRLVHRILTKALKDAVEARLLPSNPAQHAKVPARHKVEMKTWSAAQAAAFLQATAEDRLYAAWVLALVCGLRRGELAGLRWADVDFDQRTIGVVSQRTTDADWNVITKAPKGTSPRLSVGR